MVFIMSGLVECDSSDSPSRHGSNQILNEDKNFFTLEFESYESSNGREDKFALPVIPRDINSMMETPMDNNVTSVPVTSTSTAIVNDDLSKMHQPSSFYQFDWKRFPNPPIQAELKFIIKKNMSDSNDRLFDIMPLLSHLNHMFEIIYILAQDVSLDVSLLQWIDWSDIYQFIPNKVATLGIKCYEICESETGYLGLFEIQAIKISPQKEPVEPLEVHGLDNKEHTLWMNNFYNSPSLARRLKSYGIVCIRTLWTSRPFLPQKLQHIKKEDMREGEITGFTLGDVEDMVWRANVNKVAMVSTYHSNAVKCVGDSIKPVLILNYNIIGGVYKKERKLAIYPTERKMKMWYKKLFRRLLSVYVLNSYNIHRHSSSLSRKKSLMALVKSLLSKHACKIHAPVKVVESVSNTDVSRHLDQHLLQKLYGKRVMSVVCEKRTHTFCICCNKSVCLQPCFVSLHS